MRILLAIFLSCLSVSTAQIITSLTKGQVLINGMALSNYTVASTNGDIVPDYRLIMWTNTVGIPGGIPHRTTVYTNILFGASADINARILYYALQNCPSNQVVMLPAGSNNVAGNWTSAYIMIPTGVTLRGAGMTNTILSIQSGPYSGHPFLSFGGSPAYGANTSWIYDSAPTHMVITNGSTRGSSSISVSSVTGIAVGGYLVINQLNTSIVDATACSDCSPDGVTTIHGTDGSRLMGQTVEVTGISGTTISFTPPLYTDYTLTPWAVPLQSTLGQANGAALCQWAGMEDFMLYSNDSQGYQYNIAFEMAAYCWVKNVESNFTEGDHISLNWCYRCEVRDSYLHDGWSHDYATGANYFKDCALKLGYKTSACLIENNVFWRMHTSIMMNWGCSGNVIAYNYSTNNYHNHSGSDTNWQLMDFDFHNAHPQFNLFEGNICTHFEPDELHGSSAFTTCLRNWMTGENFNAPPLEARGTVLWALGNWQSSPACGLMTDYTVRTNNYVGNFVGCNRVARNYMNLSPTSWTGTDPVCWAFGYNSSKGTVDSGGTNGPTYASCLVHGNYDYNHNAQVWNPGIANHTIPPSYYLSATPAFFSGFTWPPLDPANSATAQITSIPAGYRFTQYH